MRPTVLHVLEAFAGGTERHLLDLVRHVDGVEHVIAVPTRHHDRSTGRAAELARAARARVEWVEMARPRSAHRNLGAAAALRRLVYELRPDVVHLHSSIAGAVGRLAPLPGRPPIVYTPHGLTRSRTLLVVERLLASRTDRMIAVSRSEREYALAHRLIDPARVRVIPNGIGLGSPSRPPRSLRAELAVPPGAPLVGCIGRLAWQKAPEVYVAACSRVARRLPHASFVLIGQGPDRRQIERAIAASGLPGRFHLLDSMPDASLVLGDLDLYVLPSRFEGAPYTPLEAMRAGVPVLVTDVAGNRDTVRHGRTGYIVPPDNPAALADAMVRLIEDPELRAELVAGAREVLPELDVRRMATATGALYRELLNPPLGGTPRRERRRSAPRRSRGRVPVPPRPARAPGPDHPAEPVRR